MRRIGVQLFEIVSRGVVECETSCPTKLRLEILQPAALKLGLPSEHPFLGIRQHAIEPAEYGQREDHILIMAPPEGVAN